MGASVTSHFKHNVIKEHEHKVMWMVTKVFYVNKHVKAALYQWMGIPVSRKINELVTQSNFLKNIYPDESLDKFDPF